MEQKVDATVGRPLSNGLGRLFKGVQFPGRLFPGRLLSSRLLDRKDKDEGVQREMRVKQRHAVAFKRVEDDVMQQRKGATVEGVAMRGGFASVAWIGTGQDDGHDGRLATALISNHGNLPTAMTDCVCAHANLRFLQTLRELVDKGWWMRGGEVMKL